MPAVVRGGRRQSSKSAPQKPASSKTTRSGRSTSVQNRASGGYLPGSVVGAGVAVIAVALVGVFAMAGGGSALGHSLDRLADARLADMGFRLRRVHIQGASAEGRAAIQQALSLQAGQPFARLDLDNVRAQVEAVGTVREARVVRLLPDTLIIAVTERAGLAVWQSAGRTAVVDAEGRVIEGADPGRFADLPLIVGEGAPEAAGSIIPLLNARPALKRRVDAMVRVDARRWDLRLKDGGVIQLPAVDEDEALIQLDELDQRQRVLELGFARIDLRVPEAVAVRPRNPVGISA